MRVAVFTGPTGGHFYPALAFVEALKKRNRGAEMLLVTGARGRFLTDRIPAGLRTHLRVEWLPDFPFPRPRKADFVLQAFPFLLKLAQAFWKTDRILASFRPELCVGFGSYIAFPGILLSRWRRIPTLIHEQNQKGGEANARLSRLANAVALTFEQTEGLISSSAKVTGLPLRASLVERAAVPRKTEASGRVRMLLLGGSQGSQALNRLWERALESFPAEELRKLDVTHITGERDFETVKAIYSSRRVEARVLPFYERMEELFPEADFAITRAGASTLFELALYGLPAIVFPYPYTPDGHQEQNAHYFEKEGAVVLLREASCPPERLRSEVLELIRSSEKRGRMAENLKRLARPDASEKLAELAESLVGQREGCLV